MERRGQIWLAELLNFSIHNRELENDNLATQLAIKLKLVSSESMRILKEFDSVEGTKRTYSPSSFTISSTCLNDSSVPKIGNSDSKFFLFVGSSRNVISSSTEDSKNAPRR